MAESKVTPQRKSPPASKKKITKKKPGTKKLTANLDAGNSRSINPPQHDQASPQALPQQPAPMNNMASGAQAVSWIALSLSALALCAGGYAWYLTAVDSRLDPVQQENRFNTIEQRIDRFDAAQSDTDTQIIQLQNQIASAEDGFSRQIRTIRGEIIERESAVRAQITNSEKIINRQSEDFRQEFAALADSILKLRAELGRGMDSWALEEAEQLLFIANQQLQLAGESGLAKRALELADKRIEQLADPALNRIRQLIASEITALDNIHVVDITGVLNSLARLSDNVGRLPLAGDVDVSGSAGNTTETAVSGGESESAESENSSTGVRSYIQPVVNAAAAFFSSLGDLVQVEKNGKSIRPVISAQARQITYDKVRLTLESAQIALIRQQPGLYQNRINRARKWVEENFDQASEHTRNWLLKLEEVEAVAVQSDVPDISASLTAIRDLMRSKN